MGLSEYRQKRNFRRTPEPSGRVTYRRNADPLSYVIQKHDASHLHYDFRLELEGVLKSWAVPKGPSMKAGVKRLAMETEDHPMGYGTFEGVIPKGQYGGGTVMLWDRGIWIPEGDPVKDYRRGRLRFRLEGEKLSGSWVLTRMKPKPGERKASWLLIKSGDEAAREEDEPDITEEQPLSATTGRDLAAIAEERDEVWNSNRGGGDGEGRVKELSKSKPKPKPKPKSKSKSKSKSKPLPSDLRVQLATLVGDAPEGEDWVHELKFDGYRVLCLLEDGRARVITRNGKDWTDRFAGVAEALAGLPAGTAALDGEVVVMDRRGVTSFQMLQNSLSGARVGEPLLYAFDLLHLDGEDLRRKPLLERKAALAALLDGAPERVRYSDHVIGRGPAFFEQACRTGVEGIISKRADQPYRGGRGKDWLKVKCTARQEFVIVGYSEPSGSRVGIGALLLGVHDEDGRLVYTGKVGTGFDTRTLLRLEERLAPMERKTPPVDGAPRGAKARGVHWVRPELVAEIEFTEWTDDGRIRHPSFQGLREDKEAEEVVREATPNGERPEAAPEAGAVSRGSGNRKKGKSAGKATGKGSGKAAPASGGRLEVAGVRVTSTDKVLWEEQGVTKGELFAYYEAIAEVMLPRMVDRPLTLVRCPSGAGAKCFYQKHANDSVPDLIPRVPVEEKEGPALYMYIDGLPSLIGLVQLGVLEFHVWGSRRDRLERPDRLVFDLDPDEDLPFGEVARAALDLRDRLEDLGLESFPKSTGGKGLHVVVPVTRRSSWEEAREFTRAIALAMVADEPDRFTAKMTKSRRTGRVFLDYLRNTRNATAIADYSTRSRPGAPVATPLAWEEVDPGAKQPPSHGIRDVPERVAESGDPWIGYDGVRQSITAKMKASLGIA
ncbi:MAG: DNA ligase D [Gemmatimonadetes bacterium]|nr:DNA ligase D [Gemmatimonadota bacterium]